MSHLIKLNRTLVLGCTAATVLALLVACGGDHETMAMNSQKAFDDAKKKGIPIAKGGHGGHAAMGSEEMSGLDGSGTDATTSNASSSGMKGMDMSGSKQGDMKGMDMSGMKHGDMKGMDMSGMKHGDMKGMDMSGMKQGDMKGMNMSGMKHGDMKGMDMSGMEMSPVVPQPKALQARPGETATTLLADPLDAPATSSVTAARESSVMNQEMASGSGMSMSMGTYVQQDVGRPTSGTSPMIGMEHGMPGMKMDGGGSTHDMSGMKHESSGSSKTGPSGSAPKAPMAMYVCSSHPEVVSDRPGKCPIDGTPLVKKEKQP